MGSKQSITVGAAIDAATRALSDASPTPRLDAEVLLYHACGITRTDAVAQPQRPLSDTAGVTFDALIDRRRHGEPIAYITGRREFWSLDLAVSPATLIPRPETELLVEQALARIPIDTLCRVADLGTGCGAIAIAIAHERPCAQVVATDASDAALAVARANARDLNIANLEFYHGDWFAPIRDKRFDVVVSNPPYVSAKDPHLREGDLRFEPRSALIAGGDDGLGAIRAIVSAAHGYLIAGGWILLEHGFDQAAEVCRLLAAAGFREIHPYRDLTGHERVTAGQAP